MDERLVDLECINRKLSKIAQAGIASAEIIDGKVYAHSLELQQHGGGGFNILHQDALGEFEFEISGRQASLREYRPDTFDKIFIAELNGGNVDGNKQWRESRVLPGTRLPACFAQHPTANRENETAIFGDGHELGGRDEPAIGLLPAD